MIFRVTLVFLFSSILIIMSAKEPVVLIDVNYELISELTKLSEDLTYKKEVVAKVKARVSNRVELLPDKKEFLREIKVLSEELNVPPSLLLIKFYIESRIKPTEKNSKSGASGIYQAMWFTLPKGMTTAKFRTLSATEQLKYYRQYITPYKSYIRPGHIEDLYVANICPAALINKQEVLYKRPSKEYNQNTGLDINKDGKITRKDIRKIIESYLQDE